MGAVGAGASMTMVDSSINAGNSGGGGGVMDTIAEENMNSKPHLYYLNYPMNRFLDYVIENGSKLINITSIF